MQISLSDFSQGLIAIAHALAEPGKEILAVDESTKTVGKRLGSINMENTELNRQAYRGMSFTTEGLGQHISGAILYEEMLFQHHADGESMVQKLRKPGVIPGIKFDQGLRPLLGQDLWRLDAPVSMVWWSALPTITPRVLALPSGELFSRSQLMAVFLISPFVKMHGVWPVTPDVFRSRV